MEKNKLPLWLNILSGGYFISNLLIFGFIPLFTPAFAFPDLGGTKADFPIQFFAVRHIAFAVPLLHGLIRQDAKIMRTMYTIFLVMALLDVSLLILNDYYIPVLGNFPLTVKTLIGLGAFITPSALALGYLRRNHTD